MEAYSSLNFNPSTEPSSQSFGILPNICAPGAAWVMPYHANGSSTPTFVVNTMYLVPIYPGKACTLSNLAYEITTQGTGTGTQVMRAGIYESSTTTMRPTGSPLVDFGTTDLEATVGIKNWDITNQDLSPKLYWFASVKQTSGTQTTVSVIRFIALPVMNTAYCTDTNATPATVSTTNLAYTQTSVSGALPTIGTLTGTQASVPSILFKFL